MCAAGSRPFLCRRAAATRGVAELSVYVGEEARGQGIGAELLAAMIESSERAGIWTLQTGVFPENAASLALLRRFGFRSGRRR